jgi:hypothetical protein
MSTNKKGENVTSATNIPPKRNGRKHMLLSFPKIVFNQFMIPEENPIRTRVRTISILEPRPMLLLRCFLVGGSR